MLDDSMPVLYKDQGEKYMETIIDQPPDPIRNLYMETYGRNGFKSSYAEI